MWCYEDASKEKDYACVRQAPFVLTLTFKYTDITHSTLIFTGVTQNNVHSRNSRHPTTIPVTVKATVIVTKAYMYVTL